MNITSWLSSFIDKLFPTPIIKEFEAKPLTVLSGGNTTLTWKTDKAKTVKITPIIGTVGVDGMATTVLSQTTKFTITAEGLFGIKKATQDLIVSVAAAADYEAIFDHAETRDHWKCGSLFNCSKGLFTGLLDDISRQDIEIWHNNSRIYKGKQESTAQPTELNDSIYFPTESDGDLRGLQYKNGTITETCKLRHSAASIVYKGQPCFISSEDRGEMFINAETGVDVLKLKVPAKIGIPFAACHLPLSQEVIVALADGEGKEGLATTTGVFISLIGCIAVENWNGKIIAAADGNLYNVNVDTKTTIKFFDTGSRYVNQLYYDMLNDILWCSCSGPDKLLYFDKAGVVHQVIILPGTNGKMFATRITDGWWCGGSKATWYKIVKKVA